MLVLIVFLVLTDEVSYFHYIIEKVDIFTFDISKTGQLLKVKTAHLIWRWTVFLKSYSHISYVLHKKHTLTFDFYPIKFVQEVSPMELLMTHDSEMSVVIKGALSFRQRNPHRFLIRICQVSIKKVPSPPQVSIEIELTNKNSLAFLLTWRGKLLYFTFLHLRVLSI